MTLFGYSNNEESIPTTASEVTIEEENTSTTKENSNLEELDPNLVTEWTDTGVESAVRSQLSIDSGDITVQDTSNLTSINLTSDYSISSIDDLKNTPTLTSVYLKDLKITDISVLSSLSNLYLLELNNCLDIIDYSVFNNLTSLTAIRLVSMPQDILNSVSVFTNLTHMTIDDGTINDLTPLANL